MTSTRSNGAEHQQSQAAQGEQAKESDLGSEQHANTANRLQ
jgi:hypothetical protein